MELADLTSRMVSHLIMVWEGASFVLFIGGKHNQRIRFKESALVEGNKNKCKYSLPLLLPGFHLQSFLWASAF